MSHRNKGKKKGCGFKVTRNQSRKARRGYCLHCGRLVAPYRDEKKPTQWAQSSIPYCPGSSCEKKQPGEPVPVRNWKRV